MHIGTSAPRDRIAPSSGIGASNRAQAPRMAAAASEDPPPIPAAAGRSLVSAIWTPFSDTNRAPRRARLLSSTGTPAPSGPSTDMVNPCPADRTNRSPTGAKATRLSNRWYPSARCPVMCSDRFTLAGAKTLIAISDRNGIRALFGPDNVQTDVQLAAHAVGVQIGRHIVGIDKGQGALPLEFGLNLAPDGP